jgi:3-oxoacyl-[acyl-carrier-protein] synthase II
VVTGIGIICAAGRDPGDFWRSILGGQTGLRPSGRPDLARFGPAITGEVPDEWLSALTTTAERRRYGRDVLLAVTAARQAMRQAGLDPLPAGLAERTGIVLGKCQAMTPGGPRSHDWIHATADDLASAVGVSGPRQTVATACAAGSNAVGLGRDRLRTDDSDIVLAGGVDTLQESTFAGFHSLQSIDDEPCSPYSRSAGLSLGEGSAFLVLERLESAIGRGAAILAEVMGYGLSADAHHATAPDPTGRGATLAVDRALADAGLDSGCVTYVNGHGTGTKANDAVERRIMRNVFRSALVPLTSTKSFVGHTLGASGAIEAVTTVLSITHGVIPPTANFTGVPEGDLDFVPNRARPADVDVVISNSYAFGGNNASLVLARRRPSAPPRRAGPGETAVITGIGLVGRPGIGVAAWEEFLSGGGPPLTDRDVMLSLAGQPFAAASVWRQMDGFTRLCMAAARLAVEDARLPMTRDHRDHIGLVLGTMSGAAEVRSSYTRQGNGGGARRVHDFTQVTLNTPAGTVCQALAIRGVTTTITSGGASGTLALETALDAIRLGQAEAVVVLAVDKAGPEVERVYRFLGRLDPDGGVPPYEPGAPGSTCGTAAVALVLEASQSARRRNAQVRGWVRAIAHASDNYHPYRFDPAGSRYAAAIRRAIERAGWRAADIGVIAGSAPGTDLDACEGAALRAVLAGGALAPSIPVTAMKLVTGECDAASGLVNVAAPLLLTQARLIGLPARSLGQLNGERPTALISEPARRALATSVSFGSTYGVVAVERESS